MIGTTLTLDLPDLSDSVTTAVSKFIAAFNDIADGWADQVTPAAMNINTQLDLGGNPLVNVGRMTLAEGNVNLVAGTIYYDAGEFYLVDGTGTIQLTSLGALNAAGIGGIGGDYGGTNPAAVTYDDASGEYIFTEDTGVYADLVCDDVVLHGIAGSVRLGVSSVITTARQFNFGNLPTSGSELLVYNSSGSLLESASGNTDPLTIGGALTVTGGVTASVTIPNTGHISGRDEQYKRSGDKVVPFWGGYGTATSGVGVTVGSTTVTMAVLSGGTASYYMPVDLPVGARITAASVIFNKTVAGTASLGLYRRAYYLGPTPTDTLVPSASGATTSTAGIVTVSLTNSDASETFRLGYTYYLKTQFVASADGSITHYDVNITWDMP